MEQPTLPLPPNSVEPTVDKYILSLTDKERKAYEIAKSHLMTSFSLVKSNGYIDYVKKNRISVG
jgi:transcriptional regulator CtsR